MFLAFMTFSAAIAAAITPAWSADSPGDPGPPGGVDAAGEPLISLSQLAKRVRRSRNGRPVAPSTVHRWRHPGIRGVRLECVRVGGTWFTTIAAYQAWVARLTAAGTPGEPAARPAAAMHTPKPTAHQSEVARRLDGLGI